MITNAGWNCDDPGRRVRRVRVQRLAGQRRLRRADRLQAQRRGARDRARRRATEHQQRDGQRRDLRRDGPVHRHAFAGLDATVTVGYATADGTAHCRHRLQGRIRHADLQPGNDHPDDLGADPRPTRRPSPTRPSRSTCRMPSAPAWHVFGHRHDRRHHRAPGEFRGHGVLRGDQRLGHGVRRRRSRSPITPSTPINNWTLASTGTARSTRSGMRTISSHTGNQYVIDQRRLELRPSRQVARFHFGFNGSPGNVGTDVPTRLRTQRQGPSAQAFRR